jgi:translation elongation factor P/translation initiation factor 5A
MKPAKQVMIDKIIEAIKDLGRETKENEQVSTKDKFDQVDVLLDTMKFLNNYDENVKVLNTYYAEKGKWR